jgi:hypothetical protein
MYESFYSTTLFRTASSDVVLWVQRDFWKFSAHTHMWARSEFSLSPSSPLLEIKHQTLNLLQFITNLVLCMCVLFYSSFVCISAYANAYFKTTIIKQNTEIILIAGVPSCQALPGFLITAPWPPSVCIPAVLGALAVWIQNQIKKNLSCLSLHLQLYSHRYARFSSPRPGPSPTVPSSPRPLGGVSSSKTWARGGDT